MTGLGYVDLLYSALHLRLRDVTCRSALGEMTVSKLENLAPSSTKSRSFLLITTQHHS